MAAPTAAIVIVGDEVLAGHTQDTNSHWISRRLHARGLQLLRIETVPDQAGEIEATLRRILARDMPTFLFVVGGIGPTPDDRTYEGVRRALDAELEVRPEGLEAIKGRLRARGVAGEAWADADRLESWLRMVRIPKGSEALENPAGSALGCVARSGETRLVVLPGVPRELYAMVVKVFEPRYLASFAPETDVFELTVYGDEARLWDALSDVERRFPSVALGSYPQGDGRIVLRLTGPPDAVSRAHEDLSGLLKDLRRDPG